MSDQILTKRCPRCNVIKPIEQFGLERRRKYGRQSYCRPCRYESEGLYRRWEDMMRRCTDPQRDNYEQYGARGITVCEEWIVFDNFRKWALANGYSKELELDRIENDEGYGPDNCRWVTKKHNGRNKRNTLRITAFGDTKAVGDWADDPRCKVSYNLLRSRIQRGWSPEIALTSPENARAH